MATILHLGLGAFHRAHQAACLNRLRQAGVCDWTIAAGNIVHGMEETTERLARQGGRYTLETTGADGELRYEEIHAIAEVIAFDPALARMRELAADEATRILSMTVTEGGYGEGAPLYPVLARLLDARRRANGGPITLLSCDNLRGNGHALRAGLTRYVLEEGNPGLREWMQHNCTFPCSMVDRITPRPSTELVARVRRATGRDDGAPVSAERFFQWILDDRFAAGRPPWERAGARFVADVAPFEEAKIRLLNASHSILAWAGAPAGHRFVHESAADARATLLARRYATEAVFPCLAGSPVDLPAYLAEVLARFANPWLADRLERIAAGSFAKAAVFVAPTVTESLARGGAAAAAAAIAPALFFRFLELRHRGALSLSYEDAALADGRIAAIFAATDPLAAFCAEPTLWGEQARAPAFAARLREAVGRQLSSNDP